MTSFLRRWRLLGLLGVAVSLASVGCQTNIAGMTLPSGRYLDHPPQYFPPDPDFPLTRELATQEQMARQVGNAAAPVPGALGGAPVIPGARFDGMPGPGMAPVPAPMAPMPGR